MVDYNHLSNKEAFTMIFITGDTHGGHSYDARKLNTKQWPEQKKCTREDTLIIAGDFGYLWDNGVADQYWLNHLALKNPTICFVDGNHENFDLLKEFPVVEWNGGRVHQIRDNVFHLMRGECYTIEGKKIFVLGGADSHDRQYRTEGVSWWAEEIPSEQELSHARQTLDALNWEVDYVITHTCPSRQVIALGFQPPRHAFQDFLDEMACRLTFKQWYFGHFHQDCEFEKGWIATYQQIHQLSNK